MNTYPNAMTRRGSLLMLTAGFLVAAVAPARPVSAEPTAGSSPTVPIEHLDGALLAAMKAGSHTPFAERYRALAPVIEQVFDLEGILATSVGPSWETLPPAQKATLATAFRRYTVSSYVANFDSYNGQSFRVLPDTRAVGNGEVVVQSRLSRTDGSPIKLDYVMRRGPAGWQTVDVLMDGSISRVAVQHADFSELLRSGGVQALAVGLDQKVGNLSGRMAG